MKPRSRLILASGSSGRRELLAKAGWPFVAMPSGIEEPEGVGVTDPRPFVHDLARREAIFVPVGKQGFGPSTPQSEIDAAMIAHATAGAQVV
ncbi:MAG TPA: Maf family protein, partial [Gemmatales bacterium]|nr:Maf family protein [Gemmatales bacterium]